MLRVILPVALLSASMPMGVAQAQTPLEPARNSALYYGGTASAAYFAEIEGADYDLGFALSGLVGLDLGNDTRAELELSYASAEFENSADDTSFFRLSGGFYVDFDRRILGDGQPYVGGGVGVVDIDVGNDEDNVELSGHAEAGVSIPLSAGLAFVPSLRAEYIILDDIDDQLIALLRAGLHFRP